MKCLWLVFLSLSALVFILFSLVSLSSGAAYVIEWEIFSLNSSSIVATLIYDWVSFLFLGVVLFISSMVMYYSGDYMSGDKSYSRFMYSGPPVNEIFSLQKYVQVPVLTEFVPMSNIVK